MCFERLKELLDPMAFDKNIDGRQESTKLLMSKNINEHHKATQSPMHVPWKSLVVSVLGLNMV